MASRACRAQGARRRRHSDQRWSTPSLCGEWTVRDVLAHMTATASMSPGSFFAKMVGSGSASARCRPRASPRPSAAHRPTRWPGSRPSPARPAGRLAR
ncbi:MAG: maleylpyruvate isomerase N-terminal domain-containing protein [Streptosporangiaceae bacterium]